MTMRKKQENWERQWYSDPEKGGAGLARSRRHECDPLLKIRRLDRKTLKTGGKEREGRMQKSSNTTKEPPLRMKGLLTELQVQLPVGPRGSEWRS